MQNCPEKFKKLRNHAFCLKYPVKMDMDIHREVRKWAMGRILWLVRNPITLEKIANGEIPVGPGLLDIFPTSSQPFSLKSTLEYIERLTYHAIPESTPISFMLSRKEPVNWKVKLYTKGYSDYLTNISIFVLPEGYVYAIKDDSGIHLPSDPKEFGTYLEVEERGGNTYFRKKGDVEVPEILPEIKSIIRMEKDSLQMGAVYKCVYEQMALLGAFPFSYYLVLGGQILTIAIEMAVPTLNEKGIIEYCMGCETAKNWQEVLLKNKPFEKIQTGINSIEVRECHAGGICYADLLQLYRENVGHVKEKLKIFEKQDNLAIERIDYVETALQYYFLESLFQLASLLIEPVEISIKDKYRKKISKKLEEYKEKINKIYERVRFSTEASNEEELFIIKPSEMKGFALNLSELLDLLNNLLKTENTENIRELENYFYNFQVYKMFWKCYNLLIRTIMSLLEKISSLPKESIKLTMFLPKSSPEVSSPEVTEDEIKDALPNAETYLTRILEKNGIIKFRVRKDEKDNVVKDRILYEIARQIVIFRKVKRRNPELNEINLSKCIREIIKNSPKRLNYLK